MDSCFNLSISGDVSKKLPHFVSGNSSIMPPESLFDFGKSREGGPGGGGLSERQAYSKVK